MTSRSEWLRNLKPGDKVMTLVGSIKRSVMEVTSTSRTLITIGRHKRINYRRRDGKIAGRRPMAHLFHIERP